LSLRTVYPWSCFSSCWGELKKPKGPLFQIGSAWNLDDCSSKRLHRLTESGFWYYVIISIYTSILGQFRHPEISCRWRSLKTKTGECGHLPDF